MALEKFDLTRNTALITGAAGLLGSEHASALLECGASVVLTDINMDKLLIAKNKLSKYFEPKKIFLKEMNVTDPSSIDLTVEELMQK